MKAQINRNKKDVVCILGVRFEAIVCHKNYCESKKREGAVACWTGVGGKDAASTPLTDRVQQASVTLGRSLSWTRVI